MEDTSKIKFSSWWENTAFRLQLRNKIKRDYLTLGIPVIAAVLVAIFAFQTGYVSLAPYSATVSAIAQSQASQNQNLYLIVVAVPIIAFGPYVVDNSVSMRRKARYQKDFADFLFELSELVRGGIDPSRALLTLSEGTTGSITKFVKTAAKQMQVGLTFEQAFQNLGNSIESDLAKRYADLVIQASYSGGSVANLIQKASIDMGTFLALDREKKSGLSQYTVVLYTGQVVMIALCAIMVVEFIPQIAQLSQIGAAGLGGLLGTSDLGDVNIERDFFFLVIINGFLGGLVIGKISEGKIKHGLKHSLVLILIALIAWNGFVLPSLTGPQNVTITVVSTDTTGVAGFPLQDALVVSVTNLKGQPVVSAPVTFTVSGGGSANPRVVSTDTSGQASTKITLGAAPGNYVVVISVGNSAINVTITAD